MAAPSVFKILPKLYCFAWSNDTIRNRIAVIGRVVVKPSMASEIALGADGAPSSYQPIDRLGTLASGACAVHCALSAILPEAIAAVGLGALLGHELEWGFTFAALVFAATALILGWRKHRSRPVVALLAGGIVALLLARFLEGAGEIVCISLSILGGALLVSGHLSNIRASRRARTAT
jgi:hypothetical protein